MRPRLAEEVPSSAEKLLEILRDESAKRRESLAIARAGSLLLALTLVGLILYPWIVSGRFDSDWAMSYLPFWLVVFGGVAISARHKSALALSIAYQDERLVGFLIDALEIRERGVPTLAEESLVGRPEETSLDEIRLGRLAAGVARSKNPQFVAWALGVLRYQGGRESLLALEEFALNPLPRRKRAEFVKLQELSKLALADIRLRTAARSIGALEAESLASMHQSVEGLAEERQTS